MSGKVVQFIPIKRIGGVISPKIPGDTFAGIKVDEEITLKEITTPTPVENYGKVYTKADNQLYFQDGAGNEHLIGNADITAHAADTTAHDAENQPIDGGSF